MARSWCFFCRWLGSGQWHTAQNCTICRKAIIWKKVKMESWLILGPLAVAALGWFIASEIHTLRKRIDRIEQTQPQMAITLAKLEEKVK